MTAASGLAVVDTNAWLDLFVFRDPGAAPLLRALRGPGPLRAVRSESTDREVDAVLARPAFAAFGDRAAEGLREWVAIASLVPAAARAPWTCRDADDQKFLELAYGAGACLLLTKDKALLALDRRTRRDGLRILTPSGFARAFADDGQAQCERIVQRVVAP